MVKCIGLQAICTSPSLLAVRSSSATRAALTPDQNAETKISHQNWALNQNINKCASSASFHPCFVTHRTTLVSTCQSHKRFFKAEVLRNPPLIPQLFWLFERCCRVVLAIFSRISIRFLYRPSKYDMLARLRFLFLHLWICFFCRSTILSLQAVQMASP